MPVSRPPKYVWRTTRRHGTFEKAEYDLEDTQAPPKAYLERKLAEATSTFRAEPLTAVTTAAQEDQNQTTMPTIDPHTGIFKVSTKSFAVQYPKDSEELRLRLRTFGYCWCMVRQHCPNRAVLGTINITLVDRYIDWLFGPKCWGLVTRDLRGNAMSSPTIDHVMGYDMAIRKEVCKDLNRGIDFATALANAQKDTELRNQNFLAQVTISAASSASRAITAPGVRATASSSADKAGTKRKNEDKESKSSKRRKNAKERERQKEQLAANRAPNANANQKGGNPKGGNPKGQGKGGKGGKDLPPDAKLETREGEPICINWNKNRDCARSDCSYKHVCWICFKSNHRGCEHRTTQS